MAFTKVFLQSALIGALGSIGAFGQAVISAKAGVIHYTEGEVTIGSGPEAAPVEVQTGGRYTELKNGQELHTRDGRVEILLNPGVFLRMGENSSVTMISSRLADTRLELTRGVALIEVAEVSKDNSVTLLVGDAAVSFSKMGLTRMETGSGIRVYKGEVQVMTGDTPQVLKEGREMQFGAGNVIAKFDHKSGDPLFRWANRRAEYIAMANIASANMVRQNYGSSLTGYLSTGGWVYNPYYGMMTYLPIGSDIYRSPFGYIFYSPARVQQYYRSVLQPTFNGGGGGAYAGSGMSNRSWSQDHGYYTTQSRSAGAVSMPAPSGGGPAATVSEAPAARGADVGTSRGDGGGGRGQ